MIFPDKPRPPWQYAKPKIQNTRIQSRPEEVDEPLKVPKPAGYYRERVEFGLIIIGMYFWIQYWMQFA
jgi:hypothetical protein